MQQGVRVALSSFVIGALALTGLALLASGCRRSDPASGSPAAAACLADSIGALRLRSTLPECTKRRWLCEARCWLGFGEFCLTLGYAAQTAEAPDQDRAFPLYRRACVLGEANACTNYAATIWSHKHTDEELACAQRIFDKACAVKEPFACGMVGRLMLEADTPAYSESRKYLERACDQVGGFPCRVLAKHLESGDLGEYQPGLIGTLLKRACAGGDPDACGEHQTAEETFRELNRAVPLE